MAEVPSKARAFHNYRGSHTKDLVNPTMLFRKFRLSNKEPACTSLLLALDVIIIALNTSQSNNILI